MPSRVGWRVLDLATALRDSRKCLRFLASGAIVQGWQLKGTWFPAGLKQA